MRMVKITMLKDLRLNPTQIMGDVIDAKKGDVIEVAEKVVEGMVSTGACVEGDTTEKQTPSEPKEFNLATANKAQLLEKLVELEVEAPEGATNKVLKQLVEDKETELEVEAENQRAASEGKAEGLEGTENKMLNEAPENK